jgi:hypothetical protein
MNDSSSKPEVEEQFDGFDSHDCIDLTFDLHGDNTIRPPRPEYVKYVMERRERHARLMELWKQQQDKEKANDAPEADSGADR